MEHAISSMLHARPNQAGYCRKLLLTVLSVSPAGRRRLRSFRLTSLASNVRTHLHLRPLSPPLQAGGGFCQVFGGYSHSGVEEEKTAAEPIQVKNSRRSA